MMPPRKMGVTGQSFTYAVASAMEFYVNLNSNYKDNVSPDYLRLNVPSALPDDVFNFLANNGAVSAAIMPYDASNVPPSVYSAQKYKIKNFLKLFQPTTRGQQRIYEVRKAIMRGNPVIIELSINNGFRTLKDARTWNATSDPSNAGTQYVVVVGYDEERRAVEILNSNGREWGNGGYIWVSYEDFGNLATFGYVLIM
jgi:C1A family cysteine protease